MGEECKETKWILENWKVTTDETSPKASAEDDAKFHFEDLGRDVVALERNLALLGKRVDRLVSNLRLKLEVEELFDQHSLTILASVMAVPTLIGGFWGMNIAVPWQAEEGNELYFYTIVGMCFSFMFITWFVSVTTTQQSRYHLSC